VEGVPVSRAFDESRRVFAGGVNSPVRAFRAVGGSPVFMESGLGPYLYDNEGHRYVDLCLSWGAVLLGHAEEGTVEAIRRQAARGTSFGTATEYETRLGRLIQRAFPAMERLRFTSSGTEAAMSALRLARGVTGRERIVKFEGCYHGHADSLLVKAGSGLATFGAASSAGVPAALAALTTVLPYNDTAAAEAFFKANRRQTACVIVEPVAGNMGVVPAGPAFLERLRRLTAADGALLVFDEVITGFRVGWGGVQHRVGIEPDLTVLGKVIGGGLPVGAFGGRAALMSALSPEGPVYQAGTLSGNPLSMAAGAAVLSSLDRKFYEDLETRAASFAARAARVLRRKHRNVSFARAGSMFTPFFLPRAPRNFTEAARADTRAFARFFRGLLRAGVYAPPSAFEAWFLSASHGEPEIGKVLEAFSRC